MARQFVLLRLDRITGVDLRVFDFDYDLTWMAFFLNADEYVYGRYGGRDARSAEDRLSLAGLRHALAASLDAYRHDPNARPALAGQPQRAEDYAAAKKLRRNECIHCHQVHEFRRADARAAGTFRREDLLVHPLPENVGLVLDNDRGDRVRAVTADSPAARADVRPGDVLRSVNGVPTSSSADVQYGLHRGPARGRLPIAWQRDGQDMTAELDLPDGWRKTNWTWRPSMLDILPSLSLYGDDLTAGEKKALGLSEKRLAFRQDKVVGSEAKKAGVQSGDVILGIDGRELEMSMLDFLAYVRRNHLVGDRVTLNVLRDGKRVDLPHQLK